VSTDAYMLKKENKGIEKMGSQAEPIANHLGACLLLHVPSLTLLPQPVYPPTPSRTGRGHDEHGSRVPSLEGPKVS
jgi:hypothetical protein